MECVCTVYTVHLDWILTRVGPYGPFGLPSIQTAFPGSVSQSGEPLSPGQQISPDFSVPEDLTQLSLVAKQQNQNVTSEIHYIQLNNLQQLYQYSSMEDLNID